MLISLYDCLNARYPIPPSEYIYCSKEHKLGNGNINKRKADQEDKLIFRVCQLCPDFDNMNDLTEKPKNVKMEV